MELKRDGGDEFERQPTPDGRAQKRCRSRVAPPPGCPPGFTPDLSPGRLSGDDGSGSSDCGGGGGRGGGARGAPRSGGVGTDAEAPSARALAPLLSAPPRLAATPCSASPRWQAGEGVPPLVVPPLPCCPGWDSACAALGRCTLGAAVLERLHDEDGATVDVVAWPAQPAPGGAAAEAQRPPQQPAPAPRQPSPPRTLVVYKRYEVRGSARVVDAACEEVALFGAMGGRAHTIPLLCSFGDAANNPVLVFPYVEDRRPVSPAEVRSYGRQLFEALAFLHGELRTVHRNVKRANILWDGDRLQLIDFEGACPVTAGALLPRFGNTAYRAPEVVAAKPASRREAAAAYVWCPREGCLTPASAYGPPADVWSAGVVMGELLLGARRLLHADRRACRARGVGRVCVRVLRHPGRRRR